MRQTKSQVCDRGTTWHAVDTASGQSTISILANLGPLSGKPSVGRSVGRGRRLAISVFTAGLCADSFTLSRTRRTLDARQLQARISIQQQLHQNASNRQHTAACRQFFSAQSFRTHDLIRSMPKEICAESSKYDKKRDE